MRSVQRITKRSSVKKLNRPTHTECTRKAEERAHIGWGDAEETPGSPWDVPNYKSVTKKRDEKLFRRSTYLCKNHRPRLTSMQWKTYSNGKANELFVCTFGSGGCGAHLPRIAHILSHADSLIARARGTLTAGADGKNNQVSPSPPPPHHLNDRASSAGRENACV